MKYAIKYSDLEVYKCARDLAKGVYEMSKKLPPEEKYGLSNQIRRSSRSVGAQIAEAWAKKRYVKHFISKLTDADGEQLETQHWVGVAKDCSYISEEIAQEIISQCELLGRMLHGMIHKAHVFCDPISKQ